MMTEERAYRLKEIYETVAAGDPAEWSRLLDETCSDDRELRVEVEDLLSYLPAAERFIEKPLPADEALFESVVESLSQGRRIGQYEVLEEIGRGGMGAVYRAVRADEEFHSEVAIKLVWPGFDKAEVLRRFRQERQILAGLNHPNIARLLDGGTTEEGWPYVVMEYVAGLPITEYCDRQRLSVTERLRLFGQVCEAVAYAHRHRIVHRDLKPGNIFVTTDGNGEAGEVKLLDFGIAKILDPAVRPDALSMTHTGLHAMTPEYASPEQVRGEKITEASDIYSLGVVLYELLTGIHPCLPFRFKSRGLHDILSAICEEEPWRPSQVWSIVQRRRNSPENDTPNRLSNSFQFPVSSFQSGKYPEFPANDGESTSDKLRRRLRGDLDSIILKAMRKEPGQRYGSVADLCDDLRRHLDGKPVLARKGAFGYSARKFIQRHKGLVAGTAIVIVLLLAGMWLALRQARLAREEARQSRRLAYPTRMGKAQDAYSAGDIRQVDEILGEWIPPSTGEIEDLRGFEWHYLWRSIHLDQATLWHPNPVQGAGFIGQGDRFLSWNCDSLTSDQTSPLRYRNCRVGLSDTRSGKELGHLDLNHPTARLVSQKILDDGQIILRSEEDGLIRFYDFGTGREIRRIDTRIPVSRRVETLSSQWLAGWLDNGTLLLRDLRPNGEEIALPGHHVPIQQVYIPDGGRLLFVLSQSREIKVWERATWRPLATLRGDAEILWTALDPEFRWLMIYQANQTTAVWDLRTFRKIAAQPVTSGRITAHSVISSPTRLLIGTDSGILEVREVPSLRLIASVPAHADWINHIHGRTGQSFFTTAGNDWVVKLWDATTYRQIGEARGHEGSVRSAMTSVDGKWLLTCGQDRTVRTWQVATLLAPEKITGHSGWIFAVAISPDGKRLATASQDETARIWDLQTGREQAVFRGHRGHVFGVAFSPDGRRLATSGEDQTARIWDLQTGRELHHLSGHTLQIHGLAFSPDGLMLATASDDRTVKLWETATGRLLNTLYGNAREVFTVAFSPDARYLASGGADGQIRIYEVANYRNMRALAGHSDWIWSILFSPDGRYLASGSTDKTAVIWEFAAGKKLATMRGHFDEIFSVAFSPDGKRLATASNDRTVRIWNARTGQELLNLKDHTDQAWSVAFSPDGLTLASGSWDRTVRLYRAADEAEIRARLGR